MSSAPRAPLVAVDIGNTRLKFGWFDHTAGAPLPAPTDHWETTTAEFDPAALAAWLAVAAGQSPAGGADSIAKAGVPLRWCIASVHRPGLARLGEWISTHRPADQWHALTHKDLPLTIDLAAPERVGMDRLAAAVAANRLRPAGQPAVVIDAGSAITVDLVSAAGHFCGGAILPGMKMAAAALTQQTDQLPLVPASAAERPPALGRSTEGAIRSGLYWGAVGALKELIAGLSATAGAEPFVVFAGGDAAALAPFVHPSAQHAPELVLAGIALAAAKRNP